MSHDGQGSAVGGHLEIEVKFLVPDLPALRQRLLTCGATLIAPRVFEKNVRFDSPLGLLARKGQLLRLRQDTSARLTFKGIPPDRTPSEAKVREELETEVGDFDIAAAILNRLGFAPQQVYEKYRETFRLALAEGIGEAHTVEVLLDEMPYGNFVELEGDEAGIRAAAAVLELDWQRRILDNYLALMARLKTRYDLPFDDVTFANFGGYDISIDLIFEQEDNHVRQSTIPGR